MYLYFNIFSSTLIFSLELVPCFDISGPVLAINTRHTAGYQLLLSMSLGTKVCTLPKMDILAMEDTGFIYCKFLFTVHNHHYRILYYLLDLTCIPIRLHASGLLVLNRNQESTSYMLTLLRLVTAGPSIYQSLFSLNRCLYCE